MSRVYAATCNQNFLAYPTNLGVSEDATALQEQVEEVRKHFGWSVTMGKRAREMFGALAQVREEYSVDNWDGYNARGISPSSYMNAIRFSQVLPTNVPMPEISADPDGEVDFEWYAGPRAVFSVSIGSNSDLTYAGLFGSNKTHGVEYFGDELPKTIMDGIRRVFPTQV